EMLTLRVLQRGHRLVHDEDAEVGDVLADRDRQRVVGAGDGAEEDGPELAVVAQRELELGALAVPSVVDGLQLRCSFQKKTRLELTRTCDLLRHRSVGLRRVLHCSEAPARRRSISLRPLKPYTCRPLRYDC